MFESDLFPEEGVWRNPGDDSRRMGCYILAAIGLLAGPGFTVLILGDSSVSDDLSGKVLVGVLILGFHFCAAGSCSGKAGSGSCGG